MAGDRSPLGVNSDPERLRRLLALIDEVLETRAPRRSGAALATELRERFDALGQHRLREVNPPRTDFGTAWAQARGEYLAPIERTGAVHLELGTFTTFSRGRVAELVAGDGLGEFIRLDYDPQYELDVVADATSLPLRSSSVDRVGSNSTVEHVSHPHRVFSETLRVLKPGGVTLIDMPFVWPEHGYPEDHVRFTPGHFERILAEIGFVDVLVDRDGSSGLYNVLHNAAKMASVDASAAEAAAMLELHELAIALLGALIPFDRFFVDGSRQWMHSVRVLARKPGTLEPSRRAWRPDVPFAERALDLLADPETKRPLTRKGGRVVVEGSGTAFAVSRGGAINFMEPALARTARLKALARRVKRRRPA